MHYALGQVRLASARKVIADIWIFQVTDRAAKITDANKKVINMVKNLTFARPALAAICVPVILTSAYFSVAMAFGGQVDFEIVASAVMISFFVSAAHVIILGVPAILLLKKFGFIRWWAVTLVGFLAGCIPTALLMWPVDLAHRGGFSHWDGAKEVVLRENGIPTMAGWMQYAGISLYFGAFGAVCGFVFWFVQKKTSRS